MSAPPHIYGHIVWIVMENHTYGDIIGSSDAPVAAAEMRTPFNL